VLLEFGSRKYLGGFGARVGSNLRTKVWKLGAAARPSKIFSQSYSSELDFAKRA
jgi:hypothetical protein